MKFTGFLSVFDAHSLSWEKHIVIPDVIFSEMIRIAPDKRIVCTLNNSISYHCAMMPKGSFHYILVNNELCKKLKLQLKEGYVSDVNEVVKLHQHVQVKVVEVDEERKRIQLTMDF